MAAHYPVGGNIDISVGGAFSVARAGGASGVKQMHPVDVGIISLMSMPEQSDACADLLSLSEYLVNAVFNAEAVSVSKEHLDLSGVVDIAVGRKGAEIAVARNVKYHFFGINYPELIYIAFAVAEKNERIDLRVTFNDLACSGKISVCVRKNDQPHSDQNLRSLQNQKRMYIINHIIFCFKNIQLFFK